MCVSYIYIYTYIHTCMHAYIHTHTHTHTCTNYIGDRRRAGGGHAEPPGHVTGPADAPAEQDRLVPRPAAADEGRAGDGRRRPRLHAPGLLFRDQYLPPVGAPRGPGPGVLVL